MGIIRKSVRGRLVPIAAIFVVTTGLIPNKSGGATWSEINAGLPGIAVGVNALAIDPASPSTIYAQAFSSSSPPLPGLFKSTDGGESWRAVSSVAWSVTALVIDPKQSSTLYAGTSQGVRKSTDGGATWIDSSNGLRTGSVNKLVINPLTPSTLYAVSILTGGPFSNAPVGPTAIIFKSTNGGGSWTPLDTGLPPNAFINLLVIAPATPSILYAVAPPIFVFPEPPKAVFLRSTDGGESWNPLNNDLPVPTFINFLAIDPIASSTLYASTNMGIFKSINGGESWKALNTGLPPNFSGGSLVIDSAAPSTIYSVAPLSGVPGQAPGPPSWGILKSTDGGQSWNTFTVGLPPNSNINGLAVDPITPSRIYAGVFGFPSGGFGPGVQGSGGVFKSTDGGQSWNASSAGLISFDVRTLATNSVDLGTVYAGGFGGVFKSTDSGANWNGTGLTAYTGSLVSGFSNPNLLYAQTGRSNGCGSSDRLLFRSTDAGANWSDTASPRNSGCILNVNFFSAHVIPIVIDPTNPNTLYVGESEDQDGYSALLKSTDGGANWSTAWDWFTGLRGSIRVIAIDPAIPNTLYMGLDDVSAAAQPDQPAPQSIGLFKSTDGGVTWRNTGLTRGAVNLLAIDPSKSNIMYASTEGHSDPKGFQGLFKSIDGGTSWLAINKGLSGLIESRLTTTTALIIDPANSNILYLGTSNSGLFRSADGGANWSAFNDGLTNLQVRALAVAPGTTRTVYAGTSGGVFRIVDQ